MYGLKTYVVALSAVVLTALMDVRGQALSGETEKTPPFEFGLELRNLQGWAGEVWENSPMVAGQVVFSTDSIPVGFAGKTGLEAFVWAGYYPTDNSGEFDVGIKLSKNIGDLEAGLQIGRYSMPVARDGDPKYDFAAILRQPVMTDTSKSQGSQNLGLALTKELRDLKSFGLGASYSVYIADKVKMQLRTWYKDSIVFDKNFTQDFAIFLENFFDRVGFYGAVEYAKNFKSGNDYTKFKLGIVIR